MVCDKCQKKLKTVICPEVAKKPLYKTTASKDEETKGQAIPLYKRKQMQAAQGDEIDFSKVQIDKVDEGPSLLKATTSEGQQRQKTGLHMGLLKGVDQKSFDPTGTKCKICKMGKTQQGHHYCQKCAYSKGICAMCGVKIIDTSVYKQKNI